MSPTASPFKFPQMIDREGDHQMIDPSSLQVPKSTSSSSTTTSEIDYNGDNITPQPTTTNLDNPSSAFWPNSNFTPNNQPSSFPMTPLWSFDSLNNPSNVNHTAPSIDESSNSGSTHTTPASANTKFNYPFSSSSRPGLQGSTSHMLYRNNDLVQTPSTANTQWSTTSTTNPPSSSTTDHTFMPSSMPPPPPNTASQSIGSAHYQGGIQGIHSGHTSHMSLSGALTGLSPMLAGFTTSSPTFDQNFHHPSSSSTSNSTTTAGPSPINPQLTRPGGPIRTYSANAAIPQNQRKRSNTLMTLASSTPSTSSNPNSYPYPSPRFPTSLMNNHNHTHIHPSNLTHPQSGNINRLNRQPSVPILTNNEPKRVFHPSPATAISPAIGVDMNHLPMDNDGFGGHRLSMGMNMGMPLGYSSMPMGMGIGLGMGMRSDPPMDPKPPRFKPTKEQLEILIKSYEENKNPDGPAREALAKRLGPDVRPKTLQIWFQNRRSKSRAKERDANLPKPHHSRGGSSSLGHRSSASTSTSKGGSNKGAVDLEALRGLIHDDDDPDLIVIPISVLSIANWTRFLMPGTGLSHPDLAASLRFPPSKQPSLYLYVVHQSDTFRIEIPINSTSISNLQSVQNPSLNIEAVAINFELAMSTAKYACWHDDRYDDGEGNWNEVGDFTGGETNGGGKCELTGDKEVLLSAFSRVQQYLSSQTNSTPMGNIQPTSTTGNTWRFPSMSSSSFPSGNGHGGVKTPSFEIPILGHLQSAHQHHRQRSLSEPELKSSSSGGSVDSSSLSEFEMSNKGINFNTNDNSGQVPLPSTATTSTMTNTATRNEFEDLGSAGGVGYQNILWNSINSPQSGIPINMNPTSNINGGISNSNWGFPINSETPISSTLNPSSLNSSNSGNNINFNQFATLNSGINKINNNNEDYTMSTSTGNQSEESSVHLGTPPFEFEDKSNATTITTGNIDEFGKGKERFMSGLEHTSTTDL